MTALLKKDLYLLGKQTWILLGVALLFSLTPQFESFGSAYLMVLTMTLPLTTLAYDERCHWDTYLSMTPCRPERVVCSKYLFAALLYPRTKYHQADIALLIRMLRFFLP